MGCIATAAVLGRFLEGLQQGRVAQEGLKDLKQFGQGSSGFHLIFDQGSCSSLYGCSGIMPLVLIAVMGVWQVDRRNTSKGNFRHRTCPRPTDDQICSTPDHAHLIPEGLDNRWYATVSPLMGHVVNHVLSCDVNHLPALQH